MVGFLIPTFVLSSVLVLVLGSDAVVVHVASTSLCFHPFIFLNPVTLRKI